MNNSFVNWCSNNAIQCPTDKEIFEVNGTIYLFTSSQVKLADNFLYLNVTPEECTYAAENNVTFWLFQWGTMFCQQSVLKDELTFTPFLPNNSKTYSQTSFVHSSHDPMGIGTFDAWIKSAKRLGIDCLALTDTNTLGGIIAFQTACQSNGITPLLGFCCDIAITASLKYTVRWIATCETTWSQLVQFNYIVNVEQRNIDWLDVTNITKGNGSLNLIAIFPVEWPEHLHNSIITSFKQVTTHIDNDNFQHIQYYLKQVVEKNTNFQPILCDPCYSPRFSENNPLVKKNIFLEPLDAKIARWKSFFTDEAVCKAIFNVALTNNRSLKQYSWTIPVIPRIPTYNHHPEPITLFNEIIDEGLVRIGRQKDQRYIDRVNMERDVIVEGGFVSYFLILWDVISWARLQGILVGAGRGSAGGSLIAYLMGITEIDPLKYDLLWERFLNAGRLGKKQYKLEIHYLHHESGYSFVQNHWPQDFAFGKRVSELKQKDDDGMFRILEVKQSPEYRYIGGTLPDIDTDFQSDRRDEVKSYMENRFGTDHVCSVGTYQTYGLRSIVAEIMRHSRKTAPQEIAYVTTMLDGVSGNDWVDLFINALQKPKIYSVIQNYVAELSNCDFIIGSPKSNGVHACATIITPDDFPLSKFLPIRKNGDLIVSEWQGGEMEKMGFLKEDILGIIQLKKFANILQLISTNHSKKIDLNDIDTNDEKVLEFFQNGWNEDTFHFGSAGLTSYCRSLKPNSFEELIAAIALFRPGVLSLGFHQDYIECKEGKQKVVFDHELEKNALSSTYGKTIYQEQLLMLCRDVANFDLKTADDVRKAIGKKIVELMDKYQEQFVEGAEKNGVDKWIAKKIWHKIEAGAKYSFNRSHAAAYALTGYRSQWLKVHYPLEYWQVAFSHAEDGNVANRYLREIKQSQTDIKLIGSDINRSSHSIVADKNELIWPLNKVSYCGEAATRFIVNEREINGPYFSLPEFVTRCKEFAKVHRSVYPKCPINKNVVEKLVYAGAFDGIYHVKKPLDRQHVLKIMWDFFDDPQKYWNLPGESQYEYWWSMQQLDVCGIGGIDLSTLLKQNRPFYMDDSTEKMLLSLSELDDSLIGKTVLVGGLLSDFKTRNSKNGAFGVISLSENTSNLNVTMWSEIWKEHSSEIKEAKGRVVFVTGTVKYDNYSKCLTVHCNNDTQLFVI